MSPSRPRVLTIAGTDPTGGAGVAADLKTFAAHGAYGTAVVTAVVAQDTLGVRSVHVPPADVLRAQLDAVADDVVLEAVKIGMLGSVENACAVADWLDRVPGASGAPGVPGASGGPGAPGVPGAPGAGAAGRAPGAGAGRPVVVLDPVLAASSGGALTRDPSDAMLAALREVAARVDVVTPNLGELAALAGEPVAPGWDDALAQAARLAARLTSARARAGEVLVLVTGGHLDGDRSPDALVGPDGAVAVLDGPRLDVVATHGTGCGLSSALAALRPVRASWADAARDAKGWLTGALRDGDALDVGRGPGPIDHLHGIPAPGVLSSPGSRPAHLLVLGGRSGVGKSTVAFALHDLLVADGIRHAVVEGDALDLAWPEPWEHRVAERNLADVWARYRRLGHDRLVYTNTVSVLEADELAAAVGAGTVVTAVLLTADDATAAERLAGREHGDSLAVHVERSRRASGRLAREAGPHVHRLATDGRTVAEVAREVRDLWLGVGRGPDVERHGASAPMPRPS